MTRDPGQFFLFFCDDGHVRLRLLPQHLAICRLPASDPIPSWASGSILSITRTESELSIVSEASTVPLDVQTVSGWRALRVEGVLDFSLTGVLASLAQPLAAAGVSIFAISTYDTDYILVRETDVPTAIEALSSAGHFTAAGDSAVG